MESKRLNCRTQVNVDGAIELCLRKADVNKDGKKEGAIELSNDRDGLVGFFSLFLHSTEIQCNDLKHLAV